MKRAAYLSLALSTFFTPSLFASSEEDFVDENRAPVNLHHDEVFLRTTYKLTNKPTSLETETKLLKKASELKSARVALKSNADHPLASSSVPTSQTSVSAAIDLRPTCSPIQDQGNMGSCTAHALEGALEQAMIRKTGKYVNFARRASYFHARARMGKAEGDERMYLDEDSGATIGDAALSTLTGLIPETLWPYTDDGVSFKEQPLPSCYEAGLKWLNTTGISFVKVDGTKDAIVKELSSGKTVMFGMALRASFMSSDVAKTGKVPMPKSGEEVVGGHAMLIVGHKDNTFIVRNSWSDKWGDHGYCYIPDALLLQPDVTYDLWRVSDVVKIQTVDAATQKSLERSQKQKAVHGTKQLPEPQVVLDESIIEKAKAKKAKRPFALTMSRQLVKQGLADGSL